MMILFKREEMFKSYIFFKDSTAEDLPFLEFKGINSVITAGM